MAYEKDQIDERIEESQRIGNSWRDLRKHGLYFVNQNIAKYGVEHDVTDFAKKHKALWIMAPLLVLVIINAAIMMFSHSVIIAIPSVIASLWIYQLIIRKFVLDENLYKKLLAENELASGMSLENNNLLSIDQETGQWFFQDSDEGLRTGFLVTFDYASLLDLSLKSNEHAIDDAFVPFFKQLHDNKMSFFCYDIAMTDSISYGTLQAINNAKLLEKGSWLQLIETLQNETMSSLEQNSDSKYRQYYLIYNDDFQTVTQMRPLLEGIISSTLGTQTSIVNPHICNQDEVVNFICNYYMISSFSLDNITRNVERMDISKFFDFVSFLDINGTSYTLDEITDLDDQTGTVFNEQFINASVGNYERKKKNEEKQKQMKEEKLKRERLNKIIAEQRRNQQTSKRAKPKQVGSLGVSRNAVLEKRRANKEKAEENKLRSKEKERKIEERMKEKERLRNHELDFSDSTSFSDLLNLVNKKKD